MIKSISGFAGFIWLLPLSAVAAGVSESRVWTERYPVTAGTPRLEVSNIWGNVRVRPGAGGEITITFDETRSAPDRELYDRSLETLRLDVAADEYGVSIRVGDGVRDFSPRGPCRGCRVDYQFEVLVPAGTELDVGTVMDGTIDVAGIVGGISASNVNGPIMASEVRDCGKVESVNGKVQVGFALAPGQDCEIETINGDITLALPEGSGVDVALDVFNGRMLSDFAVDPLALPAVVERSSAGGAHRYRIQQPAGVRLAGGGPLFSISSLNGDIRIRRNQ